MNRIGLVKNNSIYRIVLFSLIFACLFTTTTCLGLALDNFNTIWMKYNKLFVSALFFISFLISGLFLKYLPKIEYFVNSIKPLPTLSTLFFENNTKCLINCFVFIMLCHFPVFLAYFPGIFSYDTLYQVNFFVNHDYIEIHPILHNLMIYGAVLCSEKFHIPYLGVFLYTLIQTTVMFFIFSYNIKFLSKYNIPFVIRIFALLYFAFYPTNQVFLLISTKDVLFSGFLLLYIMFLYELVIDKEIFIKSNLKCVSLILTIFLMFSFRHNCYYAYIIILPILLFYFYNNVRISFKKITIVFLVPVLFWLIFSQVKLFYGITPPQIAPKISIPIQQIGRVRVLHDGDISDYDKKTYLEIIPPQNELNYNPYNVDVLKGDSISAKDNCKMLHSDYIESSVKNNPERFLKLYLKWGKQYPKEYIDAFLQNNYGYWYFFHKYRTEYPHFYLITYNQWSDIFGTQIVSSYPINKFIRLAYDKIFLKADFVNNPLLFCLFSIGVNSWLLLAMLLALAYKHKYKYLIPLLILVSIFWTILFGPIVLLRYVYQNFIAIPILLGFLFKKD